MLRRYPAVLSLILTLLSSSAYAQDAMVSGTAADTSKSILPGVTVTATDLLTGRTFVAVTDGRGEYVIPAVPPSRYKFQAELAGFASVIYPDVELLVGQKATVSFSMRVATVEETVTVTGESPLIDLTTAQIAGNVDRKQMEALPIQGRNWMELSMMVKGVTANTVGDTPGIAELSRFQLNLDGQEITQQTSVTSFGQPGMSRDAIAEYQVVTNLFDVSMGRSAGLQVQAITKSGTNKLSGSFYGYFRDESLNMADHFTKAVLPFSNQQVGGTFGGPIVRDRVHYFVSYERERQPTTTVVSPSALAGQTMEFSTPIELDSVMGRVDYQLAKRDRLTVRGNYYRRNLPADLGSNSHPSNMAKRPTWSHFATVNWTHVTGNNVLHEVRSGYYKYYWIWEPGPVLTPEYRFPGLTLGPPWNYPEDIHHDRIPFRYDMSWKAGEHSIKLGAEFVKGHDYGDWKARQRGQYFFRSLPANAPERFPIALWNQPERWNFTGLDSLVDRFDRTYATDYTYDTPRPTWALWLGDTWNVRRRLSLTLGVRYDVAWGDFAPPAVTETNVVIDNGLFTEDVGYRNDIRDLDNVAPRVGATWDVAGNGDFVLRGGTGLFYAAVGGNPAFDQQLWNGQKVIYNSYKNDGRPGFIADPTRGVTAEDILQGRVPLQPQSINVIAHDAEIPYTWQSNLGFQKQVSDVLAFDADLVYVKGYNEESQADPNVFYDPVTGFNKHPVLFGRPRPDYGPIRLIATRGRSDYAAVASSVTRRYRDNFQLGLTYTLMFFKNDTDLGSSGYGSTQLNYFNINESWARAPDFQRHTLRVNGIWTLPYDITLSGLYRYGSGNYASISSGADPTGVSGNRIRPDFTVIPRSTFKLDPVAAFDVRFTKDFRLPNGIRLSGIAEVFNLFNQKSFNYNLLETARTFGQARVAASRPLSGQLAFRVFF